MNGDFEEENICTEYEKNCAPEGWISTSLYADYYFDDAANAFKNKHFVGLILAPANVPAARNFLRSRLLCGLRKGAQYQLQFYIRSTHAVFDSVGIYFSAADFLYQKEKIKSSRPQLYLTNDKSLKQLDEWQKVSLTYTASGNENFITIGDFKTKGYKSHSRRPDLGNDFYFFIDDIKLTPLNPAEHLCADAEIIKEEEYGFNVRHDKLDRLVYIYTKNPPVVTPPHKTIVQRIDTLVIPDVLFATNSYALNKQANSLLDSFITQAKTLQIDSAVVEGHTDNQGSSTLNQKLSENRAASVAHYLQPQFNKSLFIRGLASEKPVADNRTAIGRQKNRRVEIYIYVRE
ncbi:MAG: OmpA family protein [Flavisolibacter sp.]|nr:OmpA family protein [Flavisolibacter sp.]